MNLRFIGIIPARYESTRFPGKPLAKIGKKTMVQRVYDQASRVLDWVVVATDDNRIYKEVKYFEGNVVMTSPDHKTGTERCNEAYTKFCKSKNLEFDVILNIQGDEPFIAPKQIKTLMNCFYDPSATIATLIKKINVQDELTNPNIVKVVVDRVGYALYFSRAVIPYIRNYDQEEWLKYYDFYKHIGIYAYKPKTLDEITRLGPTNLEKGETLEQLRWLEHGFKIKTSVTDISSFGIDTPEDIAKAMSLGMVNEDVDE